MENKKTALFIIFITVVLFLFYFDVINIELLMLSHYIIFISYIIYDGWRKT